MEHAHVHASRHVHRGILGSKTAHVGLPEKATMEHFEEFMEKRDTDRTAMLARQPWNKPFDYKLLAKFIDYQIATKANVKSFWRP